MKLSKKSLWVRWAHFEYTMLYDKNKPTEYVIPSKTDFCTLFWRSVLVTPLFGFFMGGAILVVVTGLLILSPLFGLWWICEKVFPKKERKPSVIMQWLRDFKNKTCTRVDIE